MAGRIATGMSLPRRRMGNYPPLIPSEEGNMLAYRKPIILLDTV